MRVFSEQQDTKLLQAEIIRDKIDIFNNRKGNLESLIISNYDTNKDISKNIDDIVDGNEFLAIYRRILSLKSAMMLNNDSIKDMDIKIQDLKTDYSLISKITDTEKKKEMTSRIDDKKKQYEAKKVEYLNKIRDIESDIKKTEDELKEVIRNNQKKIDELSK